MHPSQDTNVDMNNEDQLYFPGTFASNEQLQTITPFSKRTFNDVDIASRYLTSEPFREYWNRGQVPIDQEYSFGYRVNTGENKWLGDKKPFERRDYRALFAAEDNKAKTGVSNTQARAEKEFDDFWKAKNAGKNPHTTDDLLLQGDRSKFIKAEIEDYLSVKSNRGTAIRNAARVEGRFFTPLTTILEAHNAAKVNPSGFSSFEPIPQDPLAYYLNASAGANWRGTAGQYGRPINMLISENLPNYSLHKFNSFGLDYQVPPFGEFDFFHNITSGKNAHELKIKHGIELGAAVSTNPRQEAFVPRTLANTARQVGRVVSIPDDIAKIREWRQPDITPKEKLINTPTDISEIQVWGPPRVSPKMQVFNNATRVTGNALGGVAMVGDVARMLTGGDVDIAPDGMPYIASATEMGQNRGMREQFGTPGEAMWQFETDAEAKQRMSDKEISDKQQAEERKLRKEASDVMLKTKAVEENISKSPFWTTLK